MQPHVTLTIKNKVGYIEFFHPQHNALPSAILLQLEQTIKKAGNNDAINVIVLKSGGDRSFCAGASFDEMLSIEDAKTGKAFF